MSQDYQTRQLTTEEDNLSRPICTGHNQHTHIDNTRQLELNSRDTFWAQLKEHQQVDL